MLEVNCFTVFFHYLGYLAIVKCGEVVICADWLCPLRPVPQDRTAASKKLFGVVATTNPVLSYICTVHIFLMIARTMKWLIIIRKYFCYNNLG